MHLAVSSSLSRLAACSGAGRGDNNGRTGRFSSAALAIVTSMFLVLLVGGMMPAPATAADRHEFDHGHMDIFNVVPDDNGGIAMNLKEDVTGQHVQRSPEGALLRVKDAALSNFPSVATDAGLPSKGYWLPLTQNHDLLWPGWDTLGVAEAGFNAIDINFKKVSGPGEVFLFTEGSFGGLDSLLADGSYQLKSGSIIEQKYPAHTHTNWVFTQPGVYTMKVNATGDKGGKTYSTKTHTYTWLVGNDAQPSDADATDESGDDSGETSGGTDTHDGHDHDGHDGHNHDGHDHNHDGDQGGEDSVGNAPVVDADKCTATTVTEAGKLGLVPAIRDDRQSPATMISPSDVAFRLGSASKATTKSQIGAIAEGTDVFMIGSTQVKDVPWLGANTMNESILDKSNGKVRWELTGFEGPGDMEVFTSGNFGQVVGEKWFSATGGKPSGSITIARNTHVHPNWVFTQPGTYKVTIQQSTTLNDGSVVSAPTTLVFFVGENTDAAGVTDVATEGHFDLGAQLVDGAEHTVWTTADGKPCQPGQSAGQGGNGTDNGNNTDDGNGGTKPNPSTGGSSGSSGNNSSSTGGGSLASTGLGALLIPLLIFAVGLVALGLSLMRYVHK